jgi:predicted dehydrogenase
LIHTGAIGQLKLIRGGFSFMIERPEDIRLKPELGGGSIWDVGCYPISYARTAAGGIAPEEVFGWVETGPTGVDLAFAGQLRFAGGVVAQVDSAFNSEYRTGMEFIGDQGRIVVTKSFKPDALGRVYVHRGDELVDTLHFPDQELYLGEVEDLYDAAVYGKPQRIPLSDTRQNIETIRAFLASAERGAPVRLE